MDTTFHLLDPFQTGPTKLEAEPGPRGRALGGLLGELGEPGAGLSLHPHPMHPSNVGKTPVRTNQGSEILDYQQTGLYRFYDNLSPA